MKKVLLVASFVFAVLIGMLLGQYFQPMHNAHKSEREKKALYWIDPMEPQIHYPGPGKSHMNMELVPVYADESNKNEPSNSVNISPQLINNLGVRTAVVKKGALSQQIDTVGYVAPNENNIIHIHTYVEGWIKKLAVKSTGEKVSKGQLLFQLYSPTLVAAQEEYLLALENGSKSLIDASQRKLRTLMISDKQIEEIKKNRKSNQLINIYSPQEGIIETLNVREGMQVKPENEVLSLVDLSSVWIIAQIYEQQQEWVKSGMSALAKLPAFPEKIWKGKVDYVYQEVDPLTRNIKVRFLFLNPQFLLKPNMYTNVTIFMAPKSNTLNIPTEALIRSAEGNRVIVALGKGQFQVRSVATGMETIENIEILSGLKEGEKIVTSGQFLIDSEANLKSSIQRIEPLHEGKEQ